MRPPPVRSTQPKANTTTRASAGCSRGSCGPSPTSSSSSASSITSSIRRLKDYLANRSDSIRKDLVEAAELKTTATAQLAAIESKLQALPGEVNALRARGADEIKAEEQRIAAAAAAERERLLEQTRREIELQVRLAKQQILEHAADLSVQLATERIKKEVTPDDQARLVDRYLDQVKKG